MFARGGSRWRLVPLGWRISRKLRRPKRWISFDSGNPALSAAATPRRNQGTHLCGVPRGNFAVFRLLPWLESSMSVPSVKVTVGIGIVSYWSHEPRTRQEPKLPD
ncbi:MAG TPA: hypothetical protein DDW52_23770 [Planctomycetaceae bacterium]|nr:hypothetical protein [Planctomycetaceae bacterium]